MTNILCFPFATKQILCVFHLQRKKFIGEKALLEPDGELSPSKDENKDESVSVSDVNDGKGAWLLKKPVPVGKPKVTSATSKRAALCKPSLETKVARKELQNAASAPGQKSLAFLTKATAKAKGKSESDKSDVPAPVSEVPLNNEPFQPDGW